MELRNFGHAENSIPHLNFVCSFAEGIISDILKARTRAGVYETLCPQYVPYGKHA